MKYKYRYILLCYIQNLLEGIFIFLCTCGFISCQKSMKNFVRNAERTVRYLFHFSSLLCYSVNEVVLFRSGGRWSLWMSSATHPCIIDGALKPLSNQKRLGFYSNLYSASVLMPTFHREPQLSACAAASVPVLLFNKYSFTVSVLSLYSVIYHMLFY